MRACGVSLYRTALPLLGFALVGSALLFVIDDRVLGEANRTASQLRDTLRDKKPGAAPMPIASHNWHVGEDDGRIYAFEAFAVGTRASSPPTITGLSVFEAATAPYRLRSHVYATRVRFEAGQWRADHGWSQRFQKDRTASREDFDTRVLALPAVVDFQRAQVDPSSMTFGEYREYVRRLGASGVNVVEQQVTLHRKVAFPFVTIVMTLLAVPFGVTVGRKGTLYGIGLAAILAVGYFLVMTFFTAAGSAGLLPPMLAAWGANILFGTAAAYLGLTVRT
jgi:lipopolysaccharide export LptBFGC system permease protein LptF